MFIGTIVRATDEDCSCLIEQGLTAPDCTSGCFVRIALDEPTGHRQDTPPGISAIGVIYATILFDPGSGTALLPVRIPTRVVAVALLGGVEQVPGEALRITHGRPLLLPELGSRVETMDKEAVRAFHFFSDDDDGSAYLHIGYLPLLFAGNNSLRLLAALSILAQLEQLFPQHPQLLSIVQHDCARRLKEVTGTGSAPLKRNGAHGRKLHRDGR